MTIILASHAATNALTTKRLNTAMEPRFKPEQLDSFRAVSSPAAFARRNQTGDISPQSKLPDRATPENRPRYGWTETPSMRLRNPRGLRRRCQPCRWSIHQAGCRDRSRTAIPRARCHAGCRCARDRAGVNIAVVDVPAFLAGFSRSTAGELGHAPSKRGLSVRALISGPVVFRGASLAS